MGHGSASLHRQGPRWWQSTQRSGASLVQTLQTSRQTSGAPAPAELAIGAREHRAMPVVASPDSRSSRSLPSRTPRHSWLDLPSFRHQGHSAADFRHRGHFGVICCHLLSSAVICCHVTAAREYEYSCSALTRARVLLLPRMPQGRAEGVTGLDLGLQVPLRSAASTANIAECRRGSCGCSLEWSLDSRLLR